MIERCELELELTNLNGKFLEALERALRPDALSPPSNCNISLNLISGNETKLIVKITCRDVSDLRALFFSYFTIVSAILELSGVSK